MERGLFLVAEIGERAAVLGLLRVAAERQHEVLDELLVLLVHGLLHLLGYDHETGAEGLAEMAAAERRLLGRLQWKGAGLISAVR